ncbi:MAG TPA: AAA family ATPase [Caulobacteraceae bacterium]|nr:AAA family ATPase [Caulobacteraceae bacterium]
MAGSKGSVILLVGPSCAGKSTLAKAVQTLSPEPYLIQSLDGLFAAMPEAWGGAGERAHDGFRYDWLAPEGGGGAAARRVAYGPVGWGLLEGFHRAVAAYADAGVNVVVDDMLLDLNVLQDWADALAAVATLLVNVTAPKAELLRREAARTLHPTPGLVAGHFDLHRGIVADAEIDTSSANPSEAARALLGIASSPARVGALQAFRRP